MKVTNNERFVFGMLEVAMVVRDTMEYFVPTTNGQGYDVNKYHARQEIVRQMTNENSPFYHFCRQNGLGSAKDQKTGVETPNRGQKLLDNVHDLIALVYGEDARFIRVVDGKIVVDPSYYVPVLESIIGVRETLNDVLGVVVNSMKKADPNALDPKFEELIAVEQRYCRAIELRVTSMQLNSTFLRFNKAVQKYVQTLQSSTSVNPLTDPNFKPTDDPEVAFDNNEMGKLFGFMNFIINHSHETDAEFKSRCDQMRTLSRSFAGDPKIENLEEFMKTFASVFIPVIVDAGKTLEPLFADAFNSIKAFELELRAKAGQGVAPAAQPVPANDAEKVAQALNGASDPAHVANSEAVSTEGQPKKD